MKESILEILCVNTNNNYSVQITKQNENILNKKNLEDNDLNREFVRIVYCPSYDKENGIFYLRGIDKVKDHCYFSMPIDYSWQIITDFLNKLLIKNNEDVNRILKLLASKRLDITDNHCVSYSLIDNKIYRNTTFTKNHTSTLIAIINTDIQYLSNIEHDELNFIEQEKKTFLNNLKKDSSKIVTLDSTLLDNGNLLLHWYLQDAVA